jgi:signal transduction histidine kinase
MSLDTVRDDGARAGIPSDHATPADPAAAVTGTAAGAAPAGTNAAPAAGKTLGGMKIRRFAPDSILGWLVLIIVAGLAASQVITALFHNMERNEAILEIEDLRAAERIATFTAFLEHTSPVLRPGLAASISGPSMTVLVAGSPSVTEPTTSDTRLNHLGRAVSDRLRGSYWEEIRVGKIASTTKQVQRGLLPIRVSVALRDGTWINFEFSAIDSLPLEYPLLGLVVFSVLAVLLLSYYALRRVTTPLDSLTRAAEALGRSGRTEVLKETGASEVRRAARAFNEMQARIRRLIEDRATMVAAISHDLRTPITRLKLRAEFIEDQEQRDKMLRDLDEMETMIKSTLALSREDANPEPRAHFDLGDLLMDAVEGFDGVSLDIDPMLAGQQAPIEAQPIALKRAVANLIENAIVYGKSAEVSLRREGKEYRITIDDHGPGIPEAELDRVFRPFFRLEASRNRESGGAGLGLAIARSVVRAHGGDIVLKNRPEGGLRVVVSLPH